MTTKVKATKRILSVCKVTAGDTDPDFSFYGEYASRLSSDYSIDRAHDGEPFIADIPDDADDPDWNGREYRYFNPSLNYVDGWGKPLPENSDADVRRYVRQDFERMESYNAGHWCCVGLSAEATVQLTPDGPTHSIRSGGLWGIESDSGRAYFEEVWSEELAQLRAELRALGFTDRAVTRAFADATEVDR